MVKNTMGGKKAKKMKNSGPVQRATIYPSEGQMYAVVEKCHSHSNIEIYYIEEDEVGHTQLVLGLGVLRGKIIKRIKKINVGDLFIVSKRDFESVKPGAKPKLDVIHKYKDSERTTIINELPEGLKNYINMKEADLNKNRTSNIDEADEIMFENEEKLVSKTKNRRLYQNNTVSTDYLADYDLPPLSDEESEE
jgi:hypothetical protein